jgi:hypothetical protein
VTLDQASVVVAARRRVELSVALVLDVLAFGLAVAALSGGMWRAMAPVIGTLATGVALLLSLRSWAGARAVWTGDADPARLRGLVKRSLWPSVPVLVASFGVAIAVGVPPLTRVFGGSPTAGNATWTDGVLLWSLLLYLFASAGAARYALSLRR